jgi:hypothetical protein
MKLLSAFCLLAVILYFGLLTFFAEHETVLRELFAGLAGLVVLLFLPFSIVLGISAWPRNKFRAFVPALICLLGLPVGFIAAIVIGESLKSANFQKNLPRYTEVVRLIENGNIKPDAGGQIQLPEPYTDLAYSTLTWTNQGERTVEFLTDGAFPVWHAGYVYISKENADEEAKFIKARNCYERVNTNWFYVSD